MCICVCVHVSLYVCGSMCMCVYICLCACLYVEVCVCVCICVCVHVCMWRYVYVCMCVVSHQPVAHPLYYAASLWALELLLTPPSPHWHHKFMPPRLTIWYECQRSHSGCSQASILFAKLSPVPTAELGHLDNRGKWKTYCQREGTAPSFKRGWNVTPLHCQRSLGSPEMSQESQVYQSLLHFPLCSSTRTFTFISLVSWVERGEGFEWAWG